MSSGITSVDDLDNLADKVDRHSVTLGNEDAARFFAALDSKPGPNDVMHDLMADFDGGSATGAAHQGFPTG